MGAGVASQSGSANSAFTMAESTDFLALGPSYGASSSITNAIGFHAQNQGGARVTNAYGVYIDAQSSATTTNIGLYNAGITQLQGSVGIGAAVSVGSMLLVSGSGGASTGLLVGGSLITSGTLGTGIYVNPTLTAQANSDYLFAIRTIGTFAPNAKTGVTATGIWINAVTGANTFNYGLYIQAPTGATANIGLYNAGPTQLANYLDIAEITAPGTPPSLFARIYAKSDHLLYYKDSTGTERPVGFDKILRTYVQKIMATIDPGGAPSPA
jgi:hypothetical protein